MPPEQFEHPEWVAAGQRIGEYGRISNWWVGDWLRYGSTRWGEKYVEASRITGLEPKTLRNIAYVAASFELSRRRDKLTWSHHAELASLDPNEQDLWLDRAVDERLSPSDLRLALRTAQRQARGALDDPSHLDPGDRPHSVACPHCGASINLDPTSLTLTI